VEQKSDLNDKINNSRQHNETNRREQCPVHARKGGLLVIVHTCTSLMGTGDSNVTVDPIRKRGKRRGYIAERAAYTHR